MNVVTKSVLTNFTNYSNVSDSDILHQLFCDRTLAKQLRNNSTNMFNINLLPNYYVVFARQYNITSLYEGTTQLLHKSQLATTAIYYIQRKALRELSLLQLRALLHDVFALVQYAKERCFICAVYDITSVNIT